MNPIAGLLTRAKARTLAFPCKGADARDANGSPVPYNSPSAVRWCSYGAVAYENEGAPGLDVRPFLKRAAARLSPHCWPLPSVINDVHPDLIPQIFDLAIEEASK